MGSSSFHIFIHARSEQRDLIGGPTYLLGPVYKTTITQRIAVYPGKFKFILVKISPDSGRLDGRHAKENQTPVTGNLSGVQIRSVSKFVQLCCEFTRVNGFTL